MFGIESEIEFMLKVDDAFVKICPTALASGRLHSADIKDARQEQTIPNEAHLCKRIFRSNAAPVSKYGLTGPTARPRSPRRSLSHS
jgi:hypothetical protein